MNIEKITTAVETLIEKSSKQDDSNDAMRFAQAAANAANALITTRNALCVDTPKVK